MERERSSARSADFEEPSSPDPAELTRLVGLARAAEGLDRLQVAGRINTLLIALRAPGGESAEAHAILAELDVSALDGLVDGHGRDCRKEAVETLLACGFPHALSVDPKDLAHARTTARKEEKLRSEPLTEEELAFDYIQPQRYSSHAWVLMGTAVAQVIAAGYNLAAHPAEAVVAGLAASVVGVGAWLLNQTRRRSKLWQPISVMGLGAIATALVAYAARSPELALTAYICGLMVLPEKAITKDKD
jgi:hypothetical protein